MAGWRPSARSWMREVSYSDAFLALTFAVLIALVVTFEFRGRVPALPLEIHERSIA